MAKSQEYRDCTLDELKAREEDLRKELFLKKNVAKHEQKKPHLIRQTRKNIAQIKTIAREKELKSQIEG